MNRPPRRRRGDRQGRSTGTGLAGASPPGNPSDSNAYPPCSGVVGHGYARGKVLICVLMLASDANRARPERWETSSLGSSVSSHCDLRIWRVTPPAVFANWSFLILVFRSRSHAAVRQPSGKATPFRRRLEGLGLRFFKAFDAASSSRMPATPDAHRTEVVDRSKVVFGASSRLVSRTPGAGAPRLFRTILGQGGATFPSNRVRDRELQRYYISLLSLFSLLEEEPIQAPPRRK